MTVDAVSPSMSAPLLDSPSVSEAVANLPALPTALLPYAGLLFQRFPEVFLALGNPALGKEFDLPPAKGSFVIVEETGAVKLVQVVLSRCASQDGHGHDIIPGVCQKPHRLRDIFFRGDKDTADRPHIAASKVRWNNTQNEWEAIRLNPGMYDIVGSGVMDDGEAAIARRHDRGNSQQCQPSKTKATRHSRSSAEATNSNATRGDEGAVHTQQDAARQACEQLPAAVDPPGAQHFAQRAGADASAASAVASCAAAHQDRPTNGQDSQPANKVTLISWDVHSCTSSASSLPKAHGHTKAQTRKSPKHTTKNHPMPLQEPESPRSPGNFNPWAENWGRQNSLESQSTVQIWGRQNSSESQSTARTGLESQEEMPRGFGLSMMPGRERIY